MVKNTAGLSAPESQVHDDLKSARKSKWIRKSEDKSFSRFNEQGSAAEIQIEVNSKMT